MLALLPFSHGSDIYVKVTPKEYQDIEWMDLYIDDTKIRRESTYPYEWCRPNQQGDNILRNMQPGNYYLKVMVMGKCGQSTERKAMLGVSGNYNFPGNNGNSNNGNTSTCQSNSWYEQVGIHTKNNLGVDIDMNAFYTISSGSDVYVKVAPEKNEDIEWMELYVNNRMVRRESTYPYEWCRPNQNGDFALRNIAIGSYVLRVNIMDECGHNVERHTQFNVVLD